MMKLQIQQFLSRHFDGVALVSTYSAHPRTRACRGVESRVHAVDGEQFSCPLSTTFNLAISPRNLGCACAASVACNVTGNAVCRRGHGVPVRRRWAKTVHGEMGRVRSMVGRTCRYGERDTARRRKVYELASRASLLVVHRPRCRCRADEDTARSLRASVKPASVGEACEHSWDAKWR